MRRTIMAVLAGGALALWLWLDTPADTVPDTPSRDGYFVLALSWTPSWCAAEGHARGDARCATGAGAGWLVHGLWPQHDDGGWPEFCDTHHAAPTGELIRSMVDIMGSEGLARHQWNKHGRCAGLSAEAYFAQTRTAFEALSFPDSLRARGSALRLSPLAMLAAFGNANPVIGPDMATVTCRNGNAQEIRLCLDHDLNPRACDAALLSRACRSRVVTLPAKP